MAIVGIPREPGCCRVKKKEEEEEVEMVDKSYLSLLASDSSSSPAKLNSCSRIGEASRQQAITAQTEMMSLVGFPSSCCSILSVDSFADSRANALTNSLVRFSQGVNSLYSRVDALVDSLVGSLVDSVADSLPDSLAECTCWICALDSFTGSLVDSLTDSLFESVTDSLAEFSH